ncbi:MAG: nucleoside deaminase [Pseudomonadales bacterium]|nr:nucleoside deaminase [Pseudomonadales bacterium]
MISLGVNLVTTQGLSILHAEMIALSIAQRKLDSYTLNGDTMADHELLTSTEPCAMCFGAIPWSGVKHVATAATDPDARAIGFDEGAKPGDWIGELETRNIKVTTQVNRAKAQRVLQLYSRAGKTIYN